MRSFSQRVSTYRVPVPAVLWERGGEHERPGFCPEDRLSNGKGHQVVPQIQSYDCPRFSEGKTEAAWVSG